MEFLKRNVKIDFLISMQKISHGAILSVFLLKRA